MWSLLFIVGCVSAPTTLERPNRVAVDDGGIWVSDFHHHRVLRFDADGNYLRAFGSRGLGRDQLWQVYVLRPLPGGEVLVVNQRVRAVDDAAQDWELKRFVDGRATSVVALDDSRWRGGAGWIDDIVPAPGGGWLVADADAHTVFRMDPDFKMAGTWGPTDRKDLSPTQLEPLQQGWLVLDEFNHRVRKVDAEGVELLGFGDAPGEGQLRFPIALATCEAQGWVAIADLGNHRVVRYRLDGSYLDAFTPRPSGIHAPVQLLDIGVSPDCSKLYLVDSKGDRLLITSPTGALIRDLRSWE